MTATETSRPPAISAMTRAVRSLHVTWSDGQVTSYPWIWLRDHAHDEQTMHPVTQQRQVHTAALRDDLFGASADVVGDALVVRWEELAGPSAAAHDPSSSLPIAFLARHRRPSGGTSHVDLPITIWDAAAINSAWPTVDHDAVMSGDEGLRDWLVQTFRFGFSIVVGTPPSLAATEALLRRIGYVRETIFGGMWEFTADLSKADTAYTNLELRPHTDGTYSHDAPGVQLLHCLSFDGTGGASTMVDGFAVAERMRAEHPDHYATLCRVQVPGQYIGDGAHLVAARPVFRHDASGALVQVSFNNDDRAPFLLDEQPMIEFYDALRTFDRFTTDPAMQWRHVLGPGEAMLFDNWRVLHGRTSFTGVRRMCGGYVNREDVESRARQLI